MLYLLAALLLTTPALAAEPYDQRWSDIMDDLHVMETGLAINHPRPVRTERIVPDPAKTGERVAQAPVAAPIFRPKPKDICQRVGRRKVVTNGGRSWKCTR